MDEHGPEVSLQQIAVEAGTAKPKIYRHFNDKADLFHAIAGRLRDLLWARIFPNIDFAADPTREVVRRAVAEYVALVEEHPNVLRFVLQGRIPGPAEPTGRAFPEGREITMAMAEMFDVQLREMQLDRAALELAAAAAFGSASAATDWWLGSNPNNSPRMPSAEFVEHLTTIMLGTVSGTANLLGVDLDPDLPIASAAPRRAAIGGLTRHA